MPETAYVDALVADLEQDLPRVIGRCISSIFIGGGTPSLFSPEAVGHLLGALRARMTFEPDLEITLEANPGTVELQKFRRFHEVGINRLSIGIQSFDGDMLQRLGRIHDGREAVAAAEAAHAAGFDNFNLDLMFALPGQRLEQALADIDMAIDLAPAHVSLYQLTIEPNTLFHQKTPILPNEDKAWDMQQHCQARLAEHGFQQYEVSAYTKPGRQCLHNLNYWQFGDYLGIGAGAHGKLSAAKDITRLWKLKQPRAYLKAEGPARIGGKHILTPEDAGLEFMMNTLRLTGGFADALFIERTGLSVSVVEKPLRLAEARGLITYKANHIRPTEIGKRFLNELLQLFVPEPQSIGKAG